MNRRQAWADFICSPNRAGRHLASIGRGASGGYADAVDQATLEDFLRRLSDERTPDLLADYVDLSIGGYERFTATKLVRVLDALSSERRGTSEVVGPGIRGHVQWGQTLVARRTGSLPPGRYLSRVAHRTFDLPVNRALAWLVHDLVDAISRIKATVGSRRLTPSMERMEARLGEALAHHWLSDIEPSPNIAGDLALARIDAGRGFYADIIALAKRRHRLTQRAQDRRWAEILSLLAVGWLEPVNDDDLFELYALVLTLDVLEVELGLGAPIAVDLVRPGRREVAQFESERGTVSVFFDQSVATIMQTATRYQTLTSSAPAISSHPRRPDIVIRRSHPDGDRAVLIEMKNTSDPDYISESIYRCFGYLHDFQDIESLSHDGPSCILMVSGDIGMSMLSSGSLVVTNGDMRDDFARSLGAALNL